LCCATAVDICVLLLIYCHVAVTTCIQTTICFKEIINVTRDLASSVVLECLRVDSDPPFEPHRTQLTDAALFTATQNPTRLFSPSSDPTCVTHLHSTARQTVPRLLLSSCAKSHMLSASRRQPHLLHVSAVDRRQTWSMDKS